MRLINADNVKKWLDDHYDYEEFSVGYLNGLFEKIPEHKGEWEERYVEDNNPWMRRRFYCSKCGGWNTYGKSNYCPECGARMES